MSDLTPEELDAIEDALEALSADGVPAGVAGNVGERLHAYRRILTLTESAFPPADVDPRVIARVLAEAAEPQIGPANERSRAGWWRRFAFIAGPTLGVAASGAAVLWMVAPRASHDKVSAEVVARAPVAPASEVAPPPPGPPLGRSAVLEQGLADDSVESARRQRFADADAEAKAERSEGALGGRGLPPEPEPVEAAAQLGNEKIVYDPTGDAGVGAERRQAPGGAGSPVADPSKPSSPAADAPTRTKKRAPTPVGGEADGAADALTRGDRLRRAGACVAARPEYERARASANKSVRAHALAGLGLCAEQDGHDGDAERLLAQARDLDSATAAFVEAERAAARK